VEGTKVAVTGFHSVSTYDQQTVNFDYPSCIFLFGYKTKLQKALFQVMWPGATVVRCEDEPASCDKVQEYTTLHNHIQYLG
jgi:hypothetical protein